GADEEDVAEETEGQRTHYENGVNVTLVVGAEQECTLPREVLPSGNAETEQHTCQKVAELHGDKRSGGEDQTRFQERSKFGIVFIHPAEQHPPGIGVPRGQSRWRVAGVPWEHGLHQLAHGVDAVRDIVGQDRKSTRLNSSHGSISYAVFCLKKKNEAVIDERKQIFTIQRGQTAVLHRRTEAR